MSKLAEVMMSEMGQGLGAYRHLTDSGKVEKINDAEVEQYLAREETKVHVMSAPPIEVSAHRIAKELHYIGETLLAIYSVLSEADKPQEYGVINRPPRGSVLEKPMPENLIKALEALGIKVRVI